MWHTEVDGNSRWADCHQWKSDGIRVTSNSIVVGRREKLNPIVEKWRNNLNTCRTSANTFRYEKKNIRNLDLDVPPSSRANNDINSKIDSSFRYFSASRIIISSKGVRTRATRYLPISFENDFAIHIFQYEILFDRFTGRLNGLYLCDYSTRTHGFVILPVQCLCENWIEYWREFKSYTVVSQTVPGSAVLTICAQIIFLISYAYVIILTL